MRSFVATIRFPKMFAPSISRRVCPNAQRAGACFTDHRLVRLSFGGGRSPITNDSIRSGFTQQMQRERASAFTLLELLIVVGIIGLLMVLIAPAFTTMKSGSDFTNAVYGIQGVLENARTYAKANHTYVFVGFAEVDSSVDPSVSPQVTTGAAPYGRVAVAVVASKDGTRHFQWATSSQGTDWTGQLLNSTELISCGLDSRETAKVREFALLPRRLWVVDSHRASEF